MSLRRPGLVTGGLSVFVLATGTLIGMPAAAAPPAAASPSDVEEIVVTGTSIKGLDAVSALPVTVLKAEDIARTGATSAEDLFRYEQRVAELVPPDLAVWAHGGWAATAPPPHPCRMRACW